MQISIQAVLLATFIGLITASPVENVPSNVCDVPADQRDWKCAHGWDGTISTDPDLGTPFYNETGPVSLEKRTVGGIFLCEDINWGGKCGYKVQPLNTCIHMGGDWDNKISSFGPDPCTSCVTYDDKGCGIEGSGAFWGIHYPGDASGGLGTVSPWNDRISSFRCIESPTYC